MTGDETVSSETVVSFVWRAQARGCEAGIMGTVNRYCCDGNSKMHVELWAAED